MLPEKIVTHYKRVIVTNKMYKTSDDTDFKYIDDSKTIIIIVLYKEIKKLKFDNLRIMNFTQRISFVYQAKKICETVRGRKVTT